MKGSGQFGDFLKEQMAGFGSVSIRRMFGGLGIYSDGLMFALVASDVLYLKADAESANDFEAEDLRPFTYATSSGENTITSYRRAPSRCFDDPDEMTLWCRKAFAAARRAAAKKKPSKKKQKA